MSDITRILEEHHLLEKTQSELNQLKKESEPVIQRGPARLYPGSLYRMDDVLHCIVMEEGKKQLLLVSRSAIETAFEGSSSEENGLFLFRGPLSKKNALVLHDQFPFTAPVSLRQQRTTVGFGDRLGLASAAHLRVVRQFDAYPVLAQQSVRELNFTQRDFEGLVADATFLVFQEGYEDGWGADGDHLKNFEDIDAALNAKTPMITLDLTNELHPEAADYKTAVIEEQFLKMDRKIQDYILSEYVEKEFRGSHYDITFSREEAMKCALMYWDALEFTAEVDAYLRKRRGDAYDFEISIDETTFPTLPSHHLFIIRELQKRKVTVNSLAPRFIGEFQKGVDYIGDKAEFERQFIVHCEIAQTYGDYKISIHSGSDKFSVYPYIGTYTKGKLHLKTAGTSWLEAVRAICQVDPKLFRLMYKKAHEYYPIALKSYHITADLSGLPDIDTLQDSELEQYLEISPSRQLFHITFGGLLTDPEIRGPFFSTMNEHEDLYYTLLEKHFIKHLTILGLERKAANT